MNYRQVIVIFAAWGLGSAGVVAAVQWLGAAGWSLLAGVGAVVLPQILAISMITRQERKSRLAGYAGRLVYSYWGSKMSLTFLCLVVGVEILNRQEMLAAPYFIGGVVAGILGNTIFLCFRKPEDVANEELCDIIPPMKTGLDSTQPPHNSRQGS